MKIRSGFVSNSSSSSFVIIAPKDFDPFQIFEDEGEQEFMRKCFDPHTTKILGQDAKVWEMYSADEGCYDINEADGFKELAKKHDRIDSDGYPDYEYDDYLFKKLVKSFQDNKDCYVNCNYR